MVRINTCNPEDDGNKDRSENLGKAFSLFPNIAICHDTPLSVRLATLGAYYVRSGGKSLGRSRIVLNRYAGPLGRCPSRIPVLGGVFLCATGAEALYADMGHFGPQPIRLAWYGLVVASEN